MRRFSLSAVLFAASLAACTPEFNWREVQPQASGITLQFPCKPQSRTRVAMLAGETVTMTMVSCSVQGQNFALVHAELGDPARVTPALIAMRRALAANTDGREVKAEPLALAAMTPNDQAMRVRYAGRSPQGTPIEEAAAFFSRGMHVYQLAVVGAHLDAASVDAFFENLRLDA